MEPPITLVSLDHQPAVVRAAAEAVHLCVRGRVRGLTIGTGGPLLRLGWGTATGVPGGGEDAGESDEGAGVRPPP